MIIRVFFVYQYPKSLLYNIVDYSIVDVTVSRKASDESGQNDGGLERRKGHSYFLQKGGERANVVGQNLAARGSARFAGQRPSVGLQGKPCGKEASLMT